MNQYRNTDKDIHKRIYRFIFGCFTDVVRKIPKSTETIPIISQISAALTSVGANDQEADSASSARDFVSKYTIVRKETNETTYWLTLIRDLKLVERSIATQYITESEEIKNIVSSIIKNTAIHQK